MPDITNGSMIQGQDFPASVYDSDDVGIFNITNDTYIPGDSEVGVRFVAPSSGRVRITVGGGTRDNNAVDRVFISPQILYADRPAEFLAPSVTFLGLGGSPANTEMKYGSRSGLVEGLTPGETYYARVMFTCAAGGSTPAGQADVGAREIIVIPVP